MPVDFGEPRKALLKTEAPSMLAGGQRLVYLSLGLSAVALCGAGLWFWLRPPSWLDAGTGPFFGLALMAMAVADVVAVFFLRWHWGRATS